MTNNLPRTAEEERAERLAKIQKFGQQTAQRMAAELFAKQAKQKAKVAKKSN